MAASLHKTAASNVSANLLAAVLRNTTFLASWNRKCV